MTKIRLYLDVTTMLRSRKGGTVLHIGGPIVLLWLVVIFVMISWISPEAGHSIASSLAELANAFSGLAP